MKLIIPAAGRSSRFPNVRPKWLLTHPNGNMVISEAVRGLNLDDISEIYLIVLKEHLEQYQCLQGINIAFDEIHVLEKLHLVILEEQTRNPSETVVSAIERGKISGPIFIKDCDNTFQCKITPENSVAVFDLNDMELVNARNKSYVMLDDNHIIKNIVEKQIISSMFCVGGYSFEKAEDFLRVFNELKENDNLYISHIIYYMLLNGAVFKPNYVSGYCDWGTLKDWNRYRNEYCTLFIDLDGVLVKNSGEHFPPRWGETKGIRENIEVVNKLYESQKADIVITTSRKSAYRDITLAQLEREGVQYHKIIFDLPHCRRIIINDYSNTNPFKSCNAINIKRNSSDLKEMIEESMGISVD